MINWGETNSILSINVKYCMLLLYLKLFRTIVKVKVSRLCLTLWPHGLYSPWNSPGQNTGVGSLSLLQEIFLTQELNPGLPHCRRILYQLGHQGSARILEWVTHPFSSRSSRPRNRTRVSCCCVNQDEVHLHFFVCFFFGVFLRIIHLFRKSCHWWQCYSWYFVHQYHTFLSTCIWS